jgi:hypothetical protein
MRGVRRLFHGFADRREGARVTATVGRVFFVDQIELYDVGHAVSRYLVRFPLNAPDKPEQPMGCRRGD